MKPKPTQIKPADIIHQILTQPRRVHTFSTAKPNTTRAALYYHLCKTGAWINNNMSMATTENQLIVVDRSVS